MQHDIAAAEAAVKAGDAPWQAVIDAQQTCYPRCAPHGTPTPMILDDAPICVQCITDQGDSIRGRLKSLLPAREG